MRVCQATAQQVIDTHVQYPKWTAADIAAHLKCHPGYVRATGQRRNLSLPVTPRAAKTAKIKRAKTPENHNKITRLSMREELAEILFEFFDELFIERAVFEDRVSIYDEWRAARQARQSITGFLLGDPLPGRSALDL